MAEATLAIRQGETIWGYEFPPTPEPGQQLYAIALMEMPAFPGATHVASTPFVVVAAQEYRVQSTGVKAWGWVHLTSETKVEIGDMLIREGVEPGRWYYAIVGMDEPQPNAGKRKQPQQEEVTA